MGNRLWDAIMREGTVPGTWGSRRFFRNLALDQHRVAKFVGAITILCQCRRDGEQHRVIRESSKELEMAFARHVHAGQDHIHDAQPGFSSDTSACNAARDTHATLVNCRRLKRAHHGRPNSNDAARLRFHVTDRCRGPLRNVVGLIERKPRV